MSQSSASSSGAGASSASLERSAHPSLAPPRIPGRQRRRFSESVSAEPPASRPRPRGLVSLTAEVAGNLGPVGGLVSAGLSAVGGGRAPDGAPDARAESIERAWEMQRESQSFNMEYLALQESMQNENRRFSTLSNLMKARHDTAKSAISNIRV